MHAVSVIVAEQLTRRYGRRVGMEQVNLQVPEGILFGFLGPNGAGKTTTIRVLLGFLRPSSGRATVFGLDCWRDSHRLKADVGYLPGDLRLYSPMTGEDHLRICGAVRRHDMLTPGTALAERFALDLRVPVRKMSRGMRQKLGLVLALAHRPRLLILDEPTASLDPLMRDQLIGHLKQMAAEGHTVFFSSHTLSEVERLCDRVAILREGRLVADRALDALRGEARRRVTILWAADARPEAIDAPPFLAIDERRDRRWQGSLTGPVPQLIRWLHDRPIEDLAIGHPDLDSLFRRYYEQETDEP
ncbi:MAG: ABC transporter ATP-binding protein [Planctomycetota bacterium]|jgi:ABC-2 type transport system ATP-binding protein